jgi:beta-galactosidase
VDESDLCFLGGFPGPLRKCLGIRAEEIDALYPEDRNSFEWKGKTYTIFDLCELIHVESADQRSGDQRSGDQIPVEIQGSYHSDFYAGMPVLTLNHYGKGRACHIAARTGRDFLLDYYRDLSSTLGIKGAIENLPLGVTAQARSDGITDHVFVMNFTPQQHSIVTGDSGLGKKVLAPWECFVYRKKRG